MNKFDGENVWTTLSGQSQNHQPFFFLYDGKVEAVRDGKWKCVAPHEYRIVTKPGKDGLPGVQLATGGKTGLALFDLEKDPGESVDLVNQYPEIAKKMASMMNDFQKEMTGSVTELK